MQLPESGPTWQAMRLSRNHHWGNPAMIDFIEDLSRTAVRAGWKGLYVGDIAQARGGPVPGHASHQTGLDVDIWFTPPPRLDLSRAERERLSAISVLAADKRSVNANWTPVARRASSRRPPATRGSTASSSPPRSSSRCAPTPAAATPPGCARSGPGGTTPTISTSG